MEKDEKYLRAKKRVEQLKGFYRFSERESPSSLDRG
ncbi:2TM domain-containing protein [Domibacillus aminovorans]|nr:2TM domain-containing protein [Domibacillus aminovorans]